MSASARASHSHGLPARPRAGIVVLALAASCALAIAWALTAGIAARSSADTSRSLSSRARAARIASALEPWSDYRRRRARTLQLWALGDKLLASGDYNSAVEVLATAYRGDVGNAALLALFKRAQRIQSDETVRKAHLQHGHEGPGGTLKPSDIER